MILEGIVTTLNEDGTPHVSPMGPIVEPAMRSLIVRPYIGSTTCANLLRALCGVFHVTDDVELIARAAIGKLDAPPATLPCGAVEGVILASACRWYAFEVEEIDDSQPRIVLDCRVTASGSLREFFGFNRAKHAVVEAAILATRTGILPNEEIAKQYRHLAVLVEKTAGPAERRGFELLCEYVAEKLGKHPLEE